MSEQNSETLDFLRASFAPQDEQHEKTCRALQEHPERLGHLETGMAAMRRDIADVYGHMAGLSHRMRA